MADADVLIAVGARLDEMTTQAYTLLDSPVPKQKLGTKELNAGAGYKDEATYYRETLPNGVSYTIQELEKFGNKLGRNTSVYVVPPGHFFMMGDNRDNSLDSRVSAAEGGVGFVPYENLEGRATILFFSIEEGTAGWQIWNWPWALRPSRIFNSVR